MKVGVIGAGFVGSATAFSLMMRGIARTVILIDSNHEKAEAEAVDISHGAPFSYASKLVSGGYSDLSGCEVVIVTAGANQKEGETRLDLLEKNVAIFKEIIPQIVKHAPDTKLLITTNPVDIMTQVSLKLSGFQREHVIGSGTVLDTSRFRTLLGYHLGVSPKSVHVNVLGEHGDSEVLAWSNGDAGTLSIYDVAKDRGRPLTSEIMREIDDNVRNAAYRIINAKGYTNFGIAAGLARICQAIGTNEHAVLTVSSYHDEIEGIKNVCLSLPSIVGKKGIHDVLHPRLSKAEKTLLKKSAETLKEYSDKAMLLLYNLHKKHSAETEKELKNIAK